MSLRIDKELKQSIDLIREKILPDYEIALDEIRRMKYMDINSHLEIKNMDWGICYYSRHQYKEISYRVFKNQTMRGVYLDNVPAFCSSKDEIIETFETRIRSMKDIVNNHLKSHRYASKKYANSDITSSIK